MLTVDIEPAEEEKEVESGLTFSQQTVWIY